MVSTPVIDKSEDRVRDMFAQISSRYDTMNHLLSLNVDRYWRRKTVQLVPPQGTDPILDVCTGTGDLALAYWQAGNGRIDVTGSDFCPEMLDYARIKQQKRKIDQDGLRFVEADAQRLPFESDAYQIVSVAFGLRNVTDTDQGLREMTRVCKPGGRVAVLEFSRPSIQPFKGIYSFYFRQVLPRIGQALARNDKSAYEYLPQSVVQFPCGQELADRMASVGLTDVWFRPLTLGIATLYVGTK
jgi:demethylmenaquinone methyltransferase/2-methoxy-6-polyprenyl-1,4-benzoquinol methylase